MIVRQHFGFDLIYYQEKALELEHYSIQGHCHDFNQEQADWCLPFLEGWVFTKSNSLQGEGSTIFSFSSSKMRRLE